MPAAAVAAPRGRGEHEHGAQGQRDEERPLVRDAAQARLLRQRQLGLLEAPGWFDRARHGANATPPARAAGRPT